MKFMILIPHVRRDYIRPINSFSETFPWPVFDERNSHSVVWYKIFEGDEQSLREEMTKVSSEMGKDFARIRSYKSYHLTVHNLDLDLPVDGDWVPDYIRNSKYTGVGYLFDKTNSSNDLFNEWGILP